MTVYNAAISRDESNDPLVPEQFVAEVIQEAAKSSAALQLCRTVRMSSKKSRQPVLSALPQAYWVSGDTGLKQTSLADWENVHLIAEELAVIVPVPEAYIDDSGIPIWNEVRPLLGQAIATKMDSAVFFGTDAPSTFGDSVFEVADTVGNTVTAGTGSDLGVDVTDMGELLADQGFSLNGFAAKPGFLWRLAGLRSAQGAPIYQSDLTASPTGRGLYGRPLAEISTGGWDASSALLIGGDFSKAVIGLRQDVTFKVFSEGVISDGDGNVVLNLMQQDSVALRVVARYGFATANPVTTLEADSAARAPFVALLPGS